MTSRSIVAIAAVLLLSSIARAAEVKLFASGALKEAYLELLPEFEKVSGHKVSVAWSSTTDIQKRVMAGEAADLVILGNAGTEELLRQGKLVGNTLATFAKSGIYVAVRAGDPTPGIGSADALKSSVLSARAVAYSEGASGTYLVAMFRRLGIYDQVKLKASIAKANEPVGDKLVRHEADLGFHQLSELIPVKGIHIVGPLPPELQYITVFSGAIHSAAKEPTAAKALIEFLTAPAAGQSFRTHGLEPGR
jgi:molybdate transport system substrate-binding protein